MKLTYDQLRQLSQIGSTEGRIIVKNKKGKILKPPLNKWDRPQKETRSTCLEVQPRPSHAPTASHFLTCPPASSSPRPQLRGKR